MKLRRFMLWVHLVVGLVAAIELLLLGVTGAVLVFEGELEQAQNPELWRVRPEGPRLDMAEFVARVEKNSGGAKITGLRFSEDPGTAIGASLRGADGKPKSITASPYTGVVLGSTAGTNPWLPKVHQFHTNLLLGPPGKVVTATAAVMLVVLALTGLILWWPRRIWWLGDMKSGRKVNFDLHNALGFWSSLFMLMFGLTGLVIHYDNELVDLVGRLTNTPRLEIPAPPKVEAGAQPVSIAAAYEEATKAVPGAAVNSMQNLSSLKGPVRVMMRFPEDRTPGGRTNVYLHPVTGEVLMSQDSRTAPPGYRWVKLWNRQFHTGDEMGMFSRILTCLASLSLPLLAITGPLIWWGRKRRRN